jgi:hypothetical protein
MFASVRFPCFASSSRFLFILSIPVVLWEIYCTVQVGATFPVLLSIEELAKYIACIWFRGECADRDRKASADLRCQDATSQDEYVRETILEKVEDQFNEVSTKVKEQVRQWYQHKA